MEPEMDFLVKMAAERETNGFIMKHVWLKTDVCYLVWGIRMLVA